MKKNLLSFALVLFSLIPFGNIAMSQTTETKENWPFMVNPTDGYTSGDIHLFNQADFKLYFNYIDNIKRLDDKTILLKSRDYPGAPVKDTEVRLVVDKGRISASKNTQGNYLEGEFQKPIGLTQWSVNKLTKNDKEITVSVYHHSTNKLLGQTKYILKPNIIHIDTPTLYYVDLKGKTNVVDKPISKLKMNQKKPLQIKVDDGWGEKEYKIQGFSLKNHSKSIHPWRSFAGDTLSYEIIKKITLGDIYYIDAVYIKDGKEYHATPIKIEK